MKLDSGLLDVLVCPACRSTLAIDDDAAQLVCGRCSVHYRVRDGIPLMGEAAG